MARKILLADDSVTAQNMGRKILADAGYEVVTVNNGSAALKKIGEQRPDLIVLDVYMPGYSGLEVCQRLKDVGDTSRIPVLLTVGKLEPFKPEEARRVRADGFIVKPFEASELLSALSKLEDKVIPRGEASKPGRSSRSSASDDGRYDKTVAIDEDSGWKNRIAFPRRKRDKATEADVDDPSIYNPLNKDLRTVVEHKPASEPKPPDFAVNAEGQNAQLEEQRVDLSALAGSLPKDVTPEEIAALAAAAARVKAMAEGKGSDESHPQASEPSGVNGAKPESDSQATVAESIAEATATVTVPTGAEKNSDDAGSLSVSAEQTNESSPVDPVSTDVIAAISNPGPEPGLSESCGSGTESTPPGETQSTIHEPVTMAVAPVEASDRSGSRWTAISIAITPEEAATSLELEMQQAHATEEGAHFASVALNGLDASNQSLPNDAPVEREAARSAPDSESETKEFVKEDSAAEPIHAVIKNFENVGRHVSLPDAVPLEVANAPAPVAQVLQSQAEGEQKPEELAAQTGPAEATAHVDEQTSAAGPVNEESSNVASAATSIDGPESATSQPAAEEESRIAGSPSDRPELAGDANSGDVASSQSNDTTHAAWATWRRIGESADAHPESSDKPAHADTAVVPDAAMAVAAGAEDSPEETTAALDSDPAIASIVDSVLAEMRPKIVEEIARKLGKKK